MKSLRIKRLKDKEIEIGSYVKVTKSRLIDNVSKVFDKYFSGLTLRVGIKPEMPQYELSIEYLEVVSEECFNEKPAL